VAGLGRKVFVSGEILTAADLQGYAVDQSVMVFDDSTARTAAIPTASEGMVTYLKDTDLVTVFDGAAYKAVGTILQVVESRRTDVFSQSVARGATSNDAITATITPTSTSSKVLVTVSLTVGLSVDGGVMALLFRDGTVTDYRGDAAGSRIRVATGQGTQFLNPTHSESFVALDSPASTSALTYSIRLNHNITSTQTVYLNRGNQDSDLDAVGRGVSSIILMEVAG
jgi:hypothetical protein